MAPYRRHPQVLATRPAWFTLKLLVPNFYFHVTTAYSILRHNGVDLGKKDYLGAMPFKGG